MEERIYTITEITSVIKRSLEQDPFLSSVWIKGEISNLTYHSSGHIYFSLKDKDAVISSAFFKYANKTLSFKLEEGMSVLALGSVNVFEKRGVYQFITREVRLEGIGELLKKIEQLKRRLLAEGIFDQNRKRPIPELPRRIGIVTSPTGAAVRDIIKVAMRRYPNIEILIAPAKVQGDGAAESIAAAIAELNNPLYEIDVIIAGRGGGSFEDLMAFNEEITVRAFYKSRVPIISAVGHQIDHPLSDDAADYAATTPSAAAEIAVPEKEELEEHIQSLNDRCIIALNNNLKELKNSINAISSMRYFKNPIEIIQNKILLLSDIESTMLSCMKEIINKNARRFIEIPDLFMLIKNRLQNISHRFEIASQKLDNLSPLGILKKGYTIAMDASGVPIKSIKKIINGDMLSIIFADGSADTVVEKTSSLNPLKKSES